MTVIKVIYIILLMAWAAYGICFAVQWNVWRKTMQDPHGHRLTAVIKEKKRMIVPYYYTRLEFELGGKTVSVWKMLSENYISNYRPVEVPVVYSEKTSAAVTKGQHELKLAKTGLVLFTVIMVLFTAFLVYKYITYYD